MVKTGYISFIVETGGGFDPQGDPIPATKTPSDYFLCNLKPVTNKYEQYNEGQYKQAAYSAIIDKFLVSAIDVDSITEVILQDNEHNELGTFQVQSIYHAALTNSIKIVV